MRYKLELKEVEKYYYEDEEKIPLQSTTILLNGKDFIKMLSEYEFKAAFFTNNKHSIGNYEGMDINHLRKILLRFNKRVGVYQCKEHLNGDWNLTFKIKISGLNVLWTDFVLISKLPLRIYGWSSDRYEKYPSSHPVDFEIEYKDFPEVKFTILQYIFAILSGK